MKVNFSKFLQNAANVAIVIVAVLLAVVLVKNYLLPQKQGPVAPPGPTQDFRIAAGTQISLPDTQWSGSQRTLILAVSDTCHFCSESADFYKRLVQENTQKKGVRIVAVLPQDLERGKKYMEKLGVTVDEIKTLQLNQIGVRATPTLIMLDGNGVVRESWVGKLTKDKEDEVISRL